MGPFRVTPNYKNWWLWRILRSRILYWESVRPTAEGPPAGPEKAPADENQKVEDTPTAAVPLLPPSHGTKSREENRPQVDQRALTSARRKILKKFAAKAGLDKMSGLAKRLNVDLSALYAMAREDTSYYGDDTLNTMLEKIGCTRERWENPGSSKEDR
jgi:hypothetical protein